MKISLNALLCIDQTAHGILHPVMGTDWVVIPKHSTTIIQLTTIQWNKHVMPKYVYNNYILQDYHSLLWKVRNGTGEEKQEKRNFPQCPSRCSSGHPLGDYDPIVFHGRP